MAIQAHLLNGNAALLRCDRRDSLSAGVELTQFLEKRIQHRIQYSLLKSNCMSPVQRFDPLFLWSTILKFEATNVFEIIYNEKAIGFS